MGVERGSVEPAGVIEDGIEPARGDVRANPLDDLLRRERLAECRDRACAPLRADNVALRAEPPPQLGDRQSGIVTRTVDEANRSGHRKSSRYSKDRLAARIGSSTITLFRSVIAMPEPVRLCSLREGANPGRADRDTALGWRYDGYASIWEAPSCQSPNAQSRGFAQDND